MCPGSPLGSSLVGQPFLTILYICCSEFENSVHLVVLYLSIIDGE